MRGRNVLIACIVLLALLLPQVAFAGTVINVRPGLNGLYRTDRPVQLNISVANNGPAIEKAVLEVRVDKKEPIRRPQNKAVYRKELTVPANGRVDSTITIPGELALNNPRVFLLINGQEVASDVVQGMAVSGRMVGISIGEEPLSNGLPVWVDNNMDYLTLKYLPPGEIPSDILGFNVADLIIMGEHQVDGLTPAQIDNVKRWVALGGNLLLSGGAGARKGEPFAGISPVLVNGETMVSGSLDGMRANSDSIPVATGTFKEGEKQLVYGNIPVIARRNIGRGYVIYSAIGLENLGPSEVKLWEELFKGLGFSDHDMARISRDSLVHNSANIPQLQMPSVKSMAGIWAVYILLVAPGLYLLLKRLNRRDLAWFCVPAMAVVAAVGMYFSAPFHRLTGPLGQTLAVVEILDGNVTEVTAGSSYVLPRGGDLTLTVAGQSLVTPENRYNNGDWSAPVIEYNEAGQEIRYNDVEFWSMRQLSVYRIVSDFGQIQGDLQLEGDRIVGTLENNTPVDLVNSLVILGDKALEIGKLPAGQQVNINTGLNSNKFFYWERNLEKLFPDFKDGNIVERVRASEVVRPTIMKETVHLTGDFPVMQLVGYTNNLHAMMEINDTRVHNYSSAVVKQRLMLTVAENGKFSLPAGFVPVHVIESSGGIEHTPDGQVLHGDNVKLEFNLQLPGQYENIDFTTIDLTNIVHNNSYKVEVFNWENQQWEELRPEQKRLQGNEIKPYISEQYRLRLSMQSFHGMKNIMPLPGLAVEGVVKHD